MGVTISQLNFSAGEVSPEIWVRTDTAKHQAGLRTCRNSVVMRHGGSENRAGTSYVCETKYSGVLGNPVRLIPFVFNDLQTYVLEFGNLYMRVIKNGAQVTSPPLSISGITNANPAVITTSTPHGLSNYSSVSLAGISGMTQLNGRSFSVLLINATQFSLFDQMIGPTDSTLYGAWTSGGTVTAAYEIVTPYAAADLSTLQFVESADVVTIVHPSYPPQELKRTGDAAWTISPVVVGSSTLNTPSITVTGSPGGPSWNYVVTSISGTTGEESGGTSVIQTLLAPPTPSAPHTLTWTAVAGAISYRIYLAYNGFFGFVGVAGANATFINTLTIPDVTNNQPLFTPLFISASNYPSAVTYFQQRLLFAGTNNAPETVWASRSGLYKNFSGSVPKQASDAVTFTLVSKKANQVRHLVDLGRLLVLTSGGEWSINGDGSGTLTPTGINARQYSYYGSSTLTPLVIGNNALFVQARGSVVRDLAYEFQSDSYKGTELSIFSAHLVDGFTITDWAYQQIPHSIVWIVRSDGTLLGLTYVKEQQILGWHRHDFDGKAENVCSIPQGREDVLYLVVNRTVNGVQRRYIEQMQTRFVTDLISTTFMDCSLSFDGRNTDVTKTMTLSGGTTWAYTEVLTLTSNAAYFASTDIGKQILLTGSDGIQIRFTITGFTSSTVVTGSPNITVPATLRNTATTVWAKAIQVVSGINHLEGKKVSVMGDGCVVASPNNPAYQPLTVSGGSLTLDKPYSVIRVGLPYTCDIETLDIDDSQGESIVNRRKLVSQVTLQVEKSAGIWIGGKAPDNDSIDCLQYLNELKYSRPVGAGYIGPPPLQTGPIEVNIESSWSKGGRVFIRQVDPLPVSVLSVHATGLFPFKQQGA